jgi:CubicO group peptidase (beta-lactamase class C family)
MSYSSRQLTDAAAIIDPLLRLSSIYARVPGMAFGFSHDNKVILLGAHGVADLETGQPVDATSTAFRCASITKTVTATIIMRLVERGTLRLDDSVTAHLTWAKETFDPKLTVRHLLMHSGSVIRDGSNTWSGTPMPDRDTLRAELTGAATFGKPSERFRYSNIAYSLLGEIAEAATGRTFDSLVMANVVKPLGLSSTWSDLSAGARRQLATGYLSSRPGELRATAAHVKARAIAPAGGLVSTVPDLLEYQHAQFPGDERLLTVLSQREMQRPQWQRSKEPHYGLGWMTWHVDGISVVGHSGGFPGFVTMIGFAPEERIAAAVLTNANSPAASKGVQLIYHAIAGVAQKWTDTAVATKWHTRGSLAPFTGLYRLQGSDLMVSRINGSLFFVDPEDPEPLSSAARLEPRGKSRFLIASGDDFGFLGEEVTFHSDRRGKVTALLVGANLYQREDL